MDDLFLGFLVGAALVGLVWAVSRNASRNPGCEHDYIGLEGERRCWRCDRQE